MLWPWFSSIDLTVLNQSSSKDWQFKKKILLKKKKKVKFGQILVLRCGKFLQNGLTKMQY